MKNHGGLITVESEPKEGATFTVYLPALTTAACAPEIEQRVEPLEPTNGSGRVLIVDEEEAIRMLVDLTCPVAWGERTRSRRCSRSTRW